MPKKQSATSVKHQDLEKIREDYWKKGIGVDVIEKISNPHRIELRKVYKRVDPEPSNNLELDIARRNAEKSKHVRFETWDVSRRDEIPYSKIAYMLVAESENRKIDDLACELEQIEAAYKTDLAEIKKKISKSSTIIRVIPV